jgi:shikimate kinase
MKRFQSINSIFLIGMTGVGKTTLGSRLAEALDCPFIDTDKRIESQCKSTITALVEVHGLPYLRMQEAITIDEIVMHPKKCIVATGGGLPTIPQAMDKMNAAGTTVYLSASIETLLQRYAQQERLIFQHIPGSTLFEKVALLLEARIPIYSQAQLFVQVDGLIPELLVAVLIDKLQAIGAIN